MKSPYVFLPERKRREIEAFLASHQYPAPESIPFSVMAKPIESCRLSLVSMAGLYQEGQSPLPRRRLSGDPGYRILTFERPVARVHVTPGCFDPSEALEDINCIFPIDHFLAFCQEGFIRDLAPSHYGFPAEAEEADLVDAALDAARRMKSEGVDLAFGFACCAAGSHNMGVVLRTVEGEGVPTVGISVVREISERVKPPRTLFINFPFGGTLGAARERELQRKILLDSLQALPAMSTPGMIVDLPYRWQHDRR